MNDTQKEFEAWYLDEFGIDISDDFVDGEYLYDQMQERWKAWQACQNLNNERIAKLEADAKRLDYIEKKFTGLSDSERYLPFRIYWGKGSNKSIRELIDQAMQQT